LNRTAADYIKNLTKNRLMAEILCHSMLNQTTAKQKNLMGDCFTELCSR